MILKPDDNICMTDRILSGLFSSDLDETHQEVEYESLSYGWKYHDLWNCKNYFDRDSHNLSKNHAGVTMVVPYQMLLTVSDARICGFVVLLNVEGYENQSFCNTWADLMHWTCLGSQASLVDHAGLVNLAD